MTLPFHHPIGLFAALSLALSGRPTPFNSLGAAELPLTERMRVVQQAARPDLSLSGIHSILKVQWFRNCFFQYWRNC